MAATPRPRQDRAYENGYAAGYAAGRKRWADRLALSEFKADFYGRMLQRAVDELHETKAVLAAQPTTKERT